MEGADVRVCVDMTEESVNMVFNPNHERFNNKEGIVVGEEEAGRSLVFGIISNRKLVMRNKCYTQEKICVFLF